MELDPFRGLAQGYQAPSASLPRPANHEEEERTASEAKIFAYHLSIVVRDREAACERHSELLGVPEWHYSEDRTAGGAGQSQDGR